MTRRALAVFERLGQAEARAHGVSIEEVHFHEVGAIDSIVDIVGSCLALHLLQIDRVVCSRIALGSGFAHGAHGTFPLPAPATLEVLRGVPVVQRDSPYELTTPTGAALAATLSSGFGSMPPMSISAVGYGAGNDRPGEVPNVLRVVLGEDAGRSVVGRDRVVHLETNVDDMRPQWIGHLVDSLLEAGALDVTVTPTLMKKSRPGHIISVLATPGSEAPIEELLFRETTTLGLRKQELDRLVLDRETVTVRTPWGEARVKVARHGTAMVTAEPEYDDIRAIARTASVPLKEAHRRVMEAFDDARDGDPGGTPGGA